MEIVTIRIAKVMLKHLHKKGLKSTDYEVKNVDVDNFDYSSDDKWQQLKAISVKAYKELKKREFELRNK